MGTNRKVRKYFVIMKHNFYIIDRRMKGLYSKKKKERNTHDQRWLLRE